MNSLFFFILPVSKTDHRSQRGTEFIPYMFLVVLQFNMSGCHESKWASVKNFRPRWDYQIKLWWMWPSSFLLLRSTLLWTDGSFFSCSFTIESSSSHFTSTCLILDLVPWIIKIIKATTDTYYNVTWCCWSSHLNASGKQVRFHEKISLFLKILGRWMETDHVMLEVPLASQRIVT